MAEDAFGRSPGSEAWGRSVTAPTVRFLRLFPAGHEKQGHVMSRWALCSCGQKFGQYAVSEEWLAALRNGQRESYLESCDVRSDGIAYQPRRCPRCERGKT